MTDPFSAVFGDGRGTGDREPRPAAQQETLPHLDESLGAFVACLPALTASEASRIASQHAAAVRARAHEVDAAWRLARDIASKVPHISQRWDDCWDEAVCATPKQLWPQLEAAVRDAVMALAMRSILSNDQFDLLYGAWRRP